MGDDKNQQFLSSLQGMNFNLNEEDKKKFIEMIKNALDNGLTVEQIVDVVRKIASQRG